MTTPREIISQALDSAYGPEKAQDIVHALHAAGFRILGPDEIDEPTVEKCAATCEQPHTFGDGTAIVLPSGRAYATALRALGRKA